MPTLTINVTDANLDRIKAATGLTTNAEVKTWVIGVVKNAVRDNEASQIEAAEKAKVQAAIDAKDSAIEAAIAQPDVELS